jgi:predicted phage replisome organizer
MAKKYFWLKLKDNFFKQKSIKKLRKMAGGDTFTIIYLKMQLLSLTNEGKLYYEGVEDNFVEELALELDENVEDIQMTVLYLQKNNLIEFGELPDEYILPEVVGSIGSESASAERVRKHREKKRALQCNNTVTKMLPHVTQSNIEIEINKEIDIEKDIEREKKNHLLSLTFKEKLDELKKIIMKATSSNEHQVNLVFQPTRYQKNIDDLLLNIYRSDYLQGKTDKIPPLSTYTTENQINKILAGFYKTHNKPKESIGIETLQYKTENTLDDIL